MKRALLVGFVCSGCAFGDGEPFGRVAATLDARYEVRADRDRGDGWQKLVSELEVRVEMASLDIAALELVDVGGAAAASFDPATPPAGYTLCHNGHCHREDGALISYEEIVAELGGDTAPSRALLALRVGEIDLVGGEPLALECDDGCIVGRGHVGRLRLGATRLVLRGAVRDGLAEPRFPGERPFAVEVELGTEDGAGELEAATDVPFDDDHEPDVAMHVALPLSAAFFDHAVSTDGAVDDVAVRTAFAEQTLIVEMEREE